MTGYSFTTPVWEDGKWVVPAVTEVTAARMANGPEDQPRDAPSQWDRIDWRAQEEQVRRLRQRIFKAAQEGDLAKVRSLQKLTAAEQVEHATECAAGDAAQLGARPPGSTGRSR